MSAADDLRRAFLDFFKARGHREVESSPLVPEGDPSLLFTNSGMVQFKNIFTGLRKAEFKTAVTAQKCLRAGGKHNDLENVGYTARHHTFFEMLGNFSFGDYFKEQAIEYAWQFLTKEMGLDEDKLLVTVYYKDEDAARLWKKIAGLPDDRILRIATSDNFWQMGDRGPCGPCSEIFYDHGAHVAGGKPGTKDEDGDRFVEIWNLVFMQYELLEGGERRDLPAPCVDTGMGLERMLAVLEGKVDNYDTSLFEPLVKGACRELEIPQEQFQETRRVRNGIKVAVDHIRACAFLLAEGVDFTNEGRGYVLRRITRRATSKLYSINQSLNSFIFASMLGDVTNLMGTHYKELITNKNSSKLFTEEMEFSDILERGVKLLEEVIKKNPSMTILKGSTAFQLYDTYGFPLDLTEDFLRERSIALDHKGFEEAMKEQRARGRAAWIGSGASPQEAIWFDLVARCETKFHDGLDESSPVVSSAIVALVKEGKEVSALKKGEEGIVLLDNTIFYGEAGGQQGDRGKMVVFSAFLSESALSFQVTDTQRAQDGKLILHYGKIIGGDLHKGQNAYLEIDIKRRARLSAHHSSTHLLHAALRQVLGNHVKQRGSQISPDYLRFDFNHTQPVDAKQLQQIEEIVNEQIYYESLRYEYFGYEYLQKVEIMTGVSRERAEKEGAIALFGEKYGDKVRIVKMGYNAKDSRYFSIELCGGTHVEKLREIGRFKILSENSIAAGIRRIEAVAGHALTDYFEGQYKQAQSHAAAVQQENRQLHIDLKAARDKNLLHSAAVSIRAVDDMQFLQHHFRGKDDNVAPKELKPLAERLLKKYKLDCLALASDFEGKATLLVLLSPALVEQGYSALELIEPASAILQAKGGGKPSLAQCGSSHVDRLDRALEAVAQAFAEHDHDHGHGATKSKSKP